MAPNKKPITFWRTRKLKKRVLLSILASLAAGCSQGTQQQGMYELNKQKGNASLTQAAPQFSRTSKYVQQDKWFKGGNLYYAKMKEWRQASYRNKLATAADLVTGLLKIDGVDLMTVDIERELKPMAIDFVKALDAANKDGFADNLAVTEVAATLWVIMRSR